MLHKRFVTRVTSLMNDLLIKISPTRCLNAMPSWCNFQGNITYMCQCLHVTFSVSSRWLLFDRPLICHSELVLSNKLNIFHSSESQSWPLICIDFENSTYEKNCYNQRVDCDIFWGWSKSNHLLETEKFVLKQLNSKANLEGKKSHVKYYVPATSN